jgi:hypothetical protein
MDFLFQKITPFWVTGILLILVALPYGIYLLQKDSVSAIGGIYLLAGVVAVMIVMALDRLLVRFVPMPTLFIIEGILLVAGLGIGFLANRNAQSQILTLDISANTSPYFMVLYTKDPTFAQTPQSRPSGGLLLTVSDRNYVVLSDDFMPRENGWQTEFRMPANWQNGYSSTGESLKEGKLTGLYFYSGNDTELTQEQKDSLRNSLPAQLLK